MHPINITTNPSRAAVCRMLLIVGFCFSTVMLSASETISLRIGIYQNEPKIFMNEAGEAAGIYVDLLNEIAQKEGWQLEYIQGSWTDCIHWLKVGEIDIMPDMAFSLQRTEKFSFNVIPVLESWSQVYARPLLEVGHIFDLENKRVALLKGSVQEKQLQNLMAGFGLPYTHLALASFEEAFNWVSKDLADVVIANYYFGEAHYAAYHLVRTPVIFNPVSLHFALYNGLDTCVLQTLDNYLAFWKASPHSLYYQTLQSYLTPAEASTESHTHTPFLFVIAGLVVVLFIALLWLFKTLRQRKATQFETSHQLMNEAKKFRSYIDHAPVGVFVVNENGRFVEVNREACESSGYTQEELLQKEITDLLAEEARIDGIRQFQRVVAEGKASGISAFQTKHRGKRYFSIEAVRISSKRFLGFVTDVSEKISLEEEKQHHKELLNAKVEEKTRELSLRIAELEQFQEATIERELRMETLRKENDRLREEIHRLRQED